jgi:hypothetical protein
MRFLPMILDEIGAPETCARSCQMRARRSGGACRMVLNPDAR